MMTRDELYEIVKKNSFSEMSIHDAGIFWSISCRAMEKNTSVHNTTGMKFSIHREPIFDAMLFYGGLREQDVYVTEVFNDDQVRASRPDQGDPG